MTVKLARRTVLLAKVETTYGTDANPTGANDAIQASELTLSPLVADYQDDNWLSDSLGHQAQLASNRRAEIQFSCNVAKSSAGGVPPAYGDLLRGCGMTESITAERLVYYEPRSSGHESLTLKVYVDGVLHTITGARGTVSWALSPDGVPRMTFNFTGIYADPSDSANVTPSLTDWQPPQPITAATAELQIDSKAFTASAFSIDLANNIVSEDIIGGNSVLLTDRAPTGSVTINAVPLATKDFFAAAKDQTKNDLVFTIRDGEDKKIYITAPKVVFSNPRYGDRNGIRTLELDLRLTPNNGNDELAVVVYGDTA